MVNNFKTVSSRLVRKEFAAQTAQGVLEASPLEPIVLRLELRRRSGIGIEAVRRGSGRGGKRRGMSRP